MRISAFIRGLLISTLILFLFGQLGRISLLNGSATIYLYEISLVALNILLVFTYKLKPIEDIWKFMKSIYIFAAILAITFLFSLPVYSGQQNLIAFLYLVRFLCYLLFFIYLKYYAEQDKKLLKILHIPLFISVGLVIVGSLLQYIFYPDLRNLFYLGWDPHLYRLFGTFFEPVVAASIFGIYVFFLYFNLYFFKNKILVYSSIFALQIILFLTYARSAILAMTIVVFGYFLRKKVLYAVLILFFVLVAIFLLPRKSGEGVNLFRTSTINSRMTDYQKGLKLAADNPVFGIGYNHIGFRKGLNSLDHSAASFHSSFLIVLVAAGFLGLVSFIFMLYELGRINAFSTVSVIFLSIVSLFDNILLHPFILFLLFTFISLSIRPSSSGR